MDLDKSVYKFTFNANLNEGCTSLGPGDDMSAEVSHEQLREVARHLRLVQLMGRSDVQQTTAESRVQLTVWLQLNHVPATESHSRKPVQQVCGVGPPWKDELEAGVRRLSHRWTARDHLTYLVYRTCDRVAMDLSPIALLFMS